MITFPRPASDYRPIDSSPGGRNILARAVPSQIAAIFPWLTQPDAMFRLALVGAGFLPVTLIAISTFGVVGLRDLATHVLAPVVAALAIVAVRRPPTARQIGQAIVAGLVATALYDLFRFGFVLSHLEADPIPHIGAALHLHPGWVFGYLWRYLGNGSGLALAFMALGFRGVKTGAVYGIVVCAGLITLLVVSPNAQAFLFPLNFTTVVMATVGHTIYGATLGFITGRRADEARVAEDRYEGDSMTVLSETVLNSSVDRQPRDARHAA
jgi:hypothetical protein